MPKASLPRHERGRAGKTIVIVERGATGRGRGHPNATVVDAGAWGHAAAGVPARGSSIFNDTRRRKSKTVSSWKESGHGGHGCSMLTCGGGVVARCEGEVRVGSRVWRRGRTTTAYHAAHLAEPLSTCLPRHPARPACCKQHADETYVERELRKPHRLDLVEGGK